MTNDPEGVIAWAARAYVVGLIRREKFEDVVRFALECERDGYRVGWPMGLPYPTSIEYVEDESRRALSSMRRSRHALRATLRAAILVPGFHSSTSVER